MIIENHAVSYEFSARFIMDDEKYGNIQSTQNAVLSFAPFSQRGADLQVEGMDWLEKLPYSKDEIAGLDW